MTRKFTWVTVLLLLCVCVQQAFAEGALIRVTKENQARLGLRYTLSAERVSPEVVLVQMEIPREGKLKKLRGVSMSIGKTKALDNGSPILAAPLQTRPGKDGAWVVSFQLASDLADRCSVDLNVPEDASGVSYEIYGVEIKGYITDRK